MELQYCGGCGMLLREGDFEKGRARYQDNRPWCSECRPPDPVPIPQPAAPARRPASSSRIPRAQSSPRLPAVHPRPASKAPLVAALVAGAVVLILVVALLSSPGRPAPEAAPPAPRVAHPRGTPVAPARAEALERRVEELEQLAKGKGKAQEILAGVDEIRVKVRGTPLEARVRSVEERAQERQREELRASQVDLALAEATKIEASDPGGRRADGIRRLLNATLAIAGNRRDEVQAALAGYEKRLAEGGAAIRDREGPFELDGEGFVRHWLVAGTFPSPDHAGFDRDFLQGESKAEPRSGERLLLDGAARTWKGLTHDGPLANLRALDIGMPVTDWTVTYVFCLVEAVADVEGDLRVGSDDGCVVWLDGIEVGRVHLHRALKADEDTYGVRLPRGFHRLLLKIEQGDGEHGFAVRFQGKDGKAAKGLRIWR